MGVVGRRAGLGTVGPSRRRPPAPYDPLKTAFDFSSYCPGAPIGVVPLLSLIHISEPTRPY